MQIKKVRFFDPGKAYLCIKDEVDRAMQDAIVGGRLIAAGRTKEQEPWELQMFERKFADYVGTRYAVGVASGTDALVLSLKVLGVGPGHEVLCPSYTFRATVEAVHHVGATPVLYDLDGETKHLRTNKTRAVVPAHIAGEIRYPKDVGGLLMVEDSCQAIGAQAVVGDTSCYSFYPAKILGCYGDGGAIAVNDGGLYEELLVMRNHYKGRWDKYGFNSRLDNLQASVLNVKLQYLPDYIRRRKEIADEYGRRLRGVGLDTERGVYQDYIITTPSPAALQSFLAERGVETMLNGYPFPAQLTKGPMTNIYESTSLRLPCYPELENEQLDYVITQINDFTT